ncbi:uncharacterized protein LOC130799353 [Amaranthus tricolor]|uniref:uncharacterized protein LOC130799353 n=1 Tax=Amaranthus tricolor TaxID=29722 RepID=UPI002584E655|nr:uncharacterized protein LOC130799353 [Amaranthus tricolor]
MQHSGSTGVQREAETPACRRQTFWYAGRNRCGMACGNTVCEVIGFVRGMYSWVSELGGKWVRIVKSSTYFHAVIKELQASNGIFELKNSYGEVVTKQTEEIQRFYRGLQGAPSRVSIGINEVKIKDALFGINDNKYPGIDGFNAYLIKRIWETLEGIVKLVDLAQSCFTSRRKISDSVLLTRELIRGYTCQYNSPRCMIKVDISKAYDSVDWFFLRSIMEELDFSEKFVNWVLTCVTTVSFSVLEYGTSLKPFKTTKRLRDGDPLSSYLFKLSYSNSLVILMRNFHSFSRASGLEVNEVKSSVYISRVASTIKCDVMEFFGMLEGSFTLSPFTQRSSTSIIASLW